MVPVSNGSLVLTSSVHGHRRGSGPVKRSTRMLLAASVAAGGWKLVQRLTEADLHGEVVVITGGSRGLGLPHGCPQNI